MLSLSPELPLLKFLLLSLPSQSFLGYHLGFHIFFTMAFLGAAHCFTAGLFFGLDFTCICNYMPSMAVVTCDFFFFYLYRSALHVYHGNFFVNKCCTCQWLRHIYIIYSSIKTLLLSTLDELSTERHLNCLKDDLYSKWL